MPAKNSTMNVTTPSDREVVVTREFDAPARLVFEAWTNCKHLPHWLLGPEGWTMPKCEVDLRVGGKYRFGWFRPETGKGFEMYGSYVEIDPPGRLVSTESMEGAPGETLNTIILEEIEGRTHMTLTIVYDSKEFRDMVLKTGMTRGMEASFDRLSGYLESQTVY